MLLLLWQHVTLITYFSTYEEWTLFNLNSADVGPAALIIGFTCSVIDRLRRKSFKLYSFRQLWLHSWSCWHWRAQLLRPLRHRCWSIMMPVTQLEKKLPSKHITSTPSTLRIPCEQHQDIHAVQLMHRAKYGHMVLSVYRCLYESNYGPEHDQRFECVCVGER